MRVPGGFEIEEKDGRLILGIWERLDMYVPEKLTLREIDITAHIESAIEAVLKRRCL